MLELADDIAAYWFPEFLKFVLTPEKAKKIREGTVVRVTGVRIVSGASPQPRPSNTCAQQLVTVAPGTVSAATTHLGAVAKRLQLVNRQIADAQLD